MRLGFFYRVVAVDGIDDRVRAQYPPPGEPAHAGGEILLLVACDPISVDVPGGGDLYDPCGGDMHIVPNY